MPRESNRLIAIGDVHGCVHALDKILDSIEPASSDRLVFLGGLIDQGRDTRDVLDRLDELKERCQVVLIQGNHEEMLYAARESEEALRFWETCGGVATMNSYRFPGRLKDIPARHWALLDGCVPFFETEAYIFTHANYLPDLPMTSQPGHQLRWALFDPSDLQAHVSGKVVVVGHTEQPNSEIADVGFAMCIDTACWRYGCLTAIDLPSKCMWQASRWEIPHEPTDASQRSRLSVLLQKSIV